MTNETIAFLPNLLAAIVILIIGWIIGRLLGKGVAALLDRLGIDDALARTSIGKAVERQYGGAGTRGIVQFFDLIVRWFVYLIAIVAAANALNLAFLTVLVQQIIAFLPNIAIFVILLIVGFIVIDWFADFLRNLGASRRISMMSPLITAIQAFLYFVLVILALQQLKIDLTIIYIFVTPIAWGIGLGLGAAIAIIVGFGLRNRAPQMMDDFMDSIQEEASKAKPPTDPLTGRPVREPTATERPWPDESKNL
ncbi:MAG: hypothetical protein ABFC89_07600 [Methanospirillum sp.]